MGGAGYTPLAADLGDELRRVPGVEHVITVRFRRVEYDVHEAAEAIFAEELLPDMLGQRLLEGW